jgi:hypothetical protein
MSVHAILKENWLRGSGAHVAASTMRRRTTPRLAVGTALVAIAVGLYLCKEIGARNVDPHEFIDGRISTLIAPPVLHGRTP